MAFLDNSGDIILDAVLTDAGRQRLAKGDGTFKITKFALGDDEINYALYDRNHPSGSAYFDLEIMQTPIFEAFTNNIASLNSRLTTFSRTNLLYLPVLKVNNNVSSYAVSSMVQNGYILAVDTDTQDFIVTNNLEYDSQRLKTENDDPQGVLNGVNTDTGKAIRIDQGLDTKNVPVDSRLDNDLIEKQYMLEIDNRFASIVNKDSTEIPYSYIDDDDIAAYYVSSLDNTQVVQKNTTTNTATGQVIAGPRGTFIQFRLKSSIEVSTSDYLFNQLGTEVKDKFTIGTSPVTSFSSIKTILTSIRVTGLTTGYSLDVPLVLVKAIK